MKLCFFGGVLFRKSLGINDLRGSRRRKPLMFNALRNNFFLNLFKFSLDAPPLLCHTYIMTVKKDTSTLAQRVEDLTKTLNRVVALITSNLAVNLDPTGELQMTNKEYDAHIRKLQDICDEHDKRQKRLESLSEEEIQEEIFSLETASIVNALGQIGGQS